MEHRRRHAGAGNAMSRNGRAKGDEARGVVSFASCSLASFALGRCWPFRRYRVASPTVVPVPSWWWPGFLYALLFTVHHPFFFPSSVPHVPPAVLQDRPSLCYGHRPGFIATRHGTAAVTFPSFSPSSFFFSSRLLLFPFSSCSPYVRPSLLAHPRRIVPRKRGPGLS